jgi:hypothetical protein
VLGLLELVCYLPLPLGIAALVRVLQLRRRRRQGALLSRALSMRRRSVVFDETQSEPPEGEPQPDEGGDEGEQPQTDDGDEGEQQGDDA